MIAKYLLISTLLLANFCVSQSEVIQLEYDFYLKIGDGGHYNSMLLLSKNETLFLWGKPSEKTAAESEFEISINLNALDSIGSFTYTDRRKDSMYSRMPYLNKQSFIVQEAITPIAWNITDQVKKIGPYTCQKAVGIFRGREYRVWFTYDIPVSSGPWKLQGLPGLIVSASDSLGEVQFLFKSITKVKREIKPDLNSGKTISIQEFAELQKSLGDNLFKKLKSKLPRDANLEITTQKAIEIFKTKH